jgi:hypothetical protein
LPVPPALACRQISSEIKELAGKAKENKLKPEQFLGGTFTISNLGSMGVKQFTAIINSPQACILAVGGTDIKVGRGRARGAAGMSGRHAMHACSSHRANACASHVQYLPPRPAAFARSASRLGSHSQGRMRFPCAAAAPTVPRP